MTNADKFKSLFGLYATELWAMPEKDFLKWLNSEAMNCSEFPNNSDTISDEWCTDCKEYDHEKHCCPRFNKVIRRTVEEVKAQPKTGKWINGHWDGDSNFRIDGRGNCWYVRECSNCHEEIKGKPTNYCPNCGARMKEGE